MKVIYPLIFFFKKKSYKILFQYIIMKKKSASENL